MSDKEKSYRNTALLGVSSVVNILLSVIRNKVFSIYLGPAGIGQFGILNDFINSIFTVGTLGVGNSGVQAVSKASVESGDAVKKVFNSLLFAFSIISVLLVTAIFIFAGPISQSLAGNDTYIIYLRIAAFALLFKFRTSIQSILITGMKRVGMLARANILQGVITTVLGIILVIALRNQAVPYLILSLALGGWLVSYYQSNRVLKELPGHRQLLQFREMSPIFILGLFQFMGQPAGERGEPGEQELDQSIFRAGSPRLLPGGDWIYGRLYRFYHHIHHNELLSQPGDQGTGRDKGDK